MAQRITIALPGQHDWVQRASSVRDVERIEAFFGGHGYDMHRHATYAIGRTLAGVQSFHYRRSMTHSMPGEPSCCIPMSRMMVLPGQTPGFATGCSISNRH